MKPSILIVEDEKNLADSLAIIIGNEGLTVRILDKGLPAIEEFVKHDLLVLDLMLPDTSGFNVLKNIRAKNASYPIIIVSAKQDEEDIVEGLSLGADDYITKPFSVKELLLRIKRCLERKKLYATSGSHEPIVMISENLSIDFSTQTAITNEGKKVLTNQEAAVLSYLVQNEGRLVSRKELLEKTWGYNTEIETRTVDNFIVRFRKYFETDPHKPLHFVTKRGIGYVFKK